MSMEVKKEPVSETYNMDCIEFMKQFPDKHFELAVVDPPYGINIAKNGSTGRNKFSKKNWDSEIPSPEYFDELIRVTTNQIIFGGNYFPYIWKKACKDFICWNKINHHDNRADIEMAWTSFSGLAKYFEYMWDGNRYGTKNNIKGVGKPTIRIHPTQKPVALYDWIFKNYAKPGDKILDTHLGSGSSRIAAHKAGLDFYATEIDEEYFFSQEKRFADFVAQLRLF